MNMTSRFSQRIRLRHLHAFVATAQQGTLVRAAQQLGITQPALSKTLNELESLAGERLFSRNRQGAELTAAGARFLQDASRVLDALNVLGRTLASDSEALPAPLHIGALPTTLVSLVAPVVVGLQQQSPGWRMQVTTLANDALMMAVRSGQLTLGIGRMSDPSRMEGLNFELLYHETLRLVVAPHHPLLHSDVSLAEALSWPLVLSPRGTVPRQNAEALIVSHGLAVPEGCVETLSVTLARCLTLQYGYVWLVPYGAVRDDLFSNHLRALPLPTQGMAEPLGIITRQEALSSPEQQRLIAALRQRVLDVPV
ncbi:LysR substrate-binding domain-containing protein [Serratia sp. TSA_130.2]|jgi:DNA-binding transcriptional LysR family regulator|uniref:LysR substrate-binding domain-containing protein n=1 Tax=Serratia TaxID=613 RepID=UPI00062803C1|nr:MULTISPECIES: LysR substrate-binding domain-containing protein [Serratia]ASM03047.1 LysR family transcriptional regulator [Serratia marcescens]EMB2348231.1 LysR family transcriptional regulator [Serratia marcescens]KKO59894.1 bacterial regulatory helix-turn-helix, lysR family protein [Serratia ureilytica]MBH2553345.1 LysR family transcriptional regulator [Serratia ureilytica]MBH2558409.1 LysR family transcriptional regulator [Serratia ureilytica]